MRLACGILLGNGEISPFLSVVIYCENMNNQPLSITYFDFRVQHYSSLVQSEPDKNCCGCTLLRMKKIITRPEDIQIRDLALLCCIVAKN